MEGTDERSAEESAEPIVGRTYAQRREAHRDLFGTDVAAYADGRPGYPGALFDLLRLRTSLKPGAAVLEIGPGTGQATGELLACGASVVAVELNADLAAHLTRRFPDDDLEVIVGPFEDVTLPEHPFDLAVSGTAFHWVPPEIGLARCATALRRGGWLALWWNFFGDPDRDDPFHEAIQPMLERLAPELAFKVAGSGAPAGAHPHALDIEARIAEIDAAGAFGPVGHEVIPWTGRHTAAEIRTMFSTFSSWIALEPDRRARTLDALHTIAVEEFGGVVERPYLTVAYLAQRR